MLKNALPLKKGINKKIENFLDFFSAKKSYLVLLNHFKDPNDRFPYPFIYFD